MFIKIYKGLLYGFGFESVAIILTTMLVAFQCHDMDVFMVGAAIEFINVIFATVLFIITYSIESIKLRSISPKKRR